MKFTYIEDIILHIRHSFWTVSSNDSVFINDESFVLSVADQFDKGNYLTEKQRDAVIKILKKYNRVFTTTYALDIDENIRNPIFKYPPRTIPQDKTITIEEGARDRFPRIKIQFPYNPTIVTDIKKYKSLCHPLDKNFIDWDPGTKCWYFGLTELNILYLENYYNNFGFSADEKYVKWLAEIKDISNNLENYIPILDFKNGKFFYRNASSKVPVLNTSDIIEAIYHSKKYGIFCWSDDIKKELDNANLNPILYAYLNGTLSPNTKVKNLDDIKELILLSDNVLFIIPGGSELEHLKITHNFLKNLKIEDSQMTTLFRLESSFGAMCNSYIKENKLNSTLSDETRYVFISGKVPRPLLESKKNFDLVVNLGVNSAHYNLQNLTRYHYNTIPADILKHEAS